MKKGESGRPYAANPRPAIPDRGFIWLPERDLFFGYEPKLGTAMRRGDWKMIVKEDEVLLFDLKKDPKETTDVAARHPGITKSMREAIEGFRRTVVKGS